MPAAVNKITNSDLYTESLARFVATFATVLPETLQHHLFFIEGGALAVENTLKAAFDWKRRMNLAAGRSAAGSQILHFRDAFHGRSGYTLSLTNTDPVKIEHFPKFPWPRVSNPALRFPIDERVLEDVRRAEEQSLAEIRRAIAENPHDIAAIIIEPIQAEGGDHHFRPEFLRALRQIADESELLLIFDEVQTGFGTTGRWWCFEHFGVEPDLIAFGKKTQVCGVAATRRLDLVDSVFQVPSRINSTWGGNLVDMVRCRRIIEVVREDELLDNVTRVGRRLLHGIERLAERLPGLVSNPRGRGFFLAFDLPDSATRDRALTRTSPRAPAGAADRAARDPLPSAVDPQRRRGRRRPRALRARLARVVARDEPSADVAASADAQRGGSGARTRSSGTPRSRCPRAAPPSPP